MQVKCGALSISSLRVKVFMPHVALFMHKYLPMGRNRRIISYISLVKFCHHSILSHKVFFEIK